MTGINDLILSDFEAECMAWDLTDEQAEQMEEDLIRMEEQA